MTKKAILLLVFIFVPTLCFAQFKGIDNERYSELQNKLLTEKIYSKEVFEQIDAFSFGSNPNGAYDICTRIRKFNVESDFLAELNIHQNVALVRVLVENEVIVSISKISEKSFAVYDYEEELEFQKEKQESIKRINEILIEPVDNEDDSGMSEIIKRGGAMTFQEEDGTTSIIIVPKESILSPEERYQIEIKKMNELKSPYQKKIGLVARIATYALIDKYPLNAEKFTYDYLNSFGYDQLSDIMVSYFINKNETQKSIKLIDYIISKFGNNLDKRKLEDLFQKKAFACAIIGDLDTGIDIMNELIEAESDLSNSKRFNMFLKSKLYLIAGKEKENQDNIKIIENEINILDKEREIEMNNMLAEHGINVGSIPNIHMNEMAFENRLTEKRDVIYTDYEFKSVTIAEMHKWF